MPQMLIITVKYASILLLDHFEIDKIEVFVDMPLFNMNNGHTPSGFSGGHWKRTLLVGIACPQATNK